jgi:hypothetical protein
MKSLKVCLSTGAHPFVDPAYSANKKLSYFMALVNGGPETVDAFGSRLVPVPTDSIAKERAAGECTRQHLYNCRRW